MGQRRTEWIRTEQITLEPNRLEETRLEQDIFQPNRLEQNCLG